MTRFRFASAAGAAVEAAPSGWRSRLLAVALVLLACLPLAGTPDPRVPLTAEEQAFLAGRRIRLGVDSARPPFEFVDEKGAYSGICAGFAQECARRLGLAVEVVPGLTVAQAVDRMAAGDLEVVPKITPTAARAGRVLFTRAYITFPSVIVTRRDCRPVAGLDDLQGLRTGVLKGLVVEELLRHDHPGLPLIPLANIREALLSLSTGSLDAFVDNLGTVSYNIDRIGLTNLRIAATTPYAHDLAFAVRADLPLLRSSLDKALASLTEPERAALKARWLTLSYHTGPDWRALAPFGAGGAVLLAFILAWNRRLRGAVRRQEVAEAALREHTLRLEAQDQVRSELAVIATDLQKAETFEDLAGTFLDRAAPLLGLAHGVLHVLEGSGRLRAVGGYCLDGALGDLPVLAPGEGLVGQCARELKPLDLDGAGAPPLRIRTGRGWLAPRQVLILPVARLDRALGVLTLATLGRFEPAQRALLDALLPTLALNLELLSGHLETRRLLEDAVRRQRTPLSEADPS